MPNHLGVGEDTLALGVAHLASKCALQTHCRSRCRIAAVMAESWAVWDELDECGPSLIVVTRPSFHVLSMLDVLRNGFPMFTGDAAGRFTMQCYNRRGIAGGVIEVQMRSKTPELRLCIFCLTAARCLRCAACKGPWYCCIECQRQDWEARHKEECAGRPLWRAVRKALRQRRLPLPLVQKVHRFL